MNANDYDFVVNQQVQKSLQVLTTKAQQYATDDLLHAFKRAAELQGVSLRAALVGMMAKHTVSIYDMCESENANPIEIWEEKIGDHINYLLILKAIVVEELLQGGEEIVSEDVPLDFSQAE